MINILDLGMVGYKESYDLQRDLIKKRKLNEIPDTALLLEHAPVFTIGRSGSKKNLLVDEDRLRRDSIDVIESDRGGDITFHGPGQLVLYPIVDLNNYQRDISLYLRQLEEVIIKFLSQYGIIGFRKEKKTGIWVTDNEKIGFIGIGVRRWITYHGLSVNINTTLNYFDMIKPCGIDNCRIASVSSLLNKDVNISEAKARFMASLRMIFQGGEGDVSLCRN